MKMFSIVSILLTVPVSAQIYKYQKPNGKVLFTDSIIYEQGYVLLASIQSNGSRRSAGQSRSAQYYDADITRIASRNGVNKALVLAIIKTESSFNPDAVSRAGAEGLMQLMPKTARSYQVYDSFNPLENIRGGTEHLKYLLNKYNNNTTLALAAYNAGETAVQKYKGVPPFPETQRYIKKVLTFKKEFE